MRQTCIGAIGSNIYVRLPHLRARIWTVALPFGLLCGQAKSASAANDLRLDAHFVAHEASFQPGPSRSPIHDAAPDSMLALPSAAAVYSDYWTAFADQDLITLRQAAQSDPEAQFAEAMTLLAAGNQESAESAFAAASQQSNDLMVATAAQVMLAVTLRYQRKWIELRDLRVNSKLGTGDREITSDLESWGKAFAASGLAS